MGPVYLETPHLARVVLMCLECSERQRYPEMLGRHWLLGYR